MIGICSSRSLWGTHLQFTNDASELAHAWKLMLSVLADTRAQAQSPEQVELIDEIGRAISSQWAVYPDFYSVSFCADRGLLGQWPGYGSMGGGYAIGFETRGLVCPPSAFSQPERFLNRVIYEPDTQLEMLRGIADSMLALFATVDPTGEEITTVRARILAALGEVVGFAFNFKDPAWAEEQEWRGVYVLPSGELDGVRFRPAGGVAVPYESMEMGAVGDERLPIREVVLGPSVDAETARKSLEMLLASSGYSDVEIRVSAVPLLA